MAMCHTQNIVPSSALQRELNKKKEREEQKKIAEPSGGEGDSAPGQPGGAKAAAESPEIPVQDMIPWCFIAMSLTSSSCSWSGS